MPELCRFFGIIITMFYNDHAPPHFHVRYNEHKAIMAIDTLTLLEGLSTAAGLGVSRGMGRVAPGRVERRLGSC